MTTPFSLLCDRCGLSHREAADFLRVRIDTVKSWSSGRNRAPDGALDELRALYTRIETAAGETIKVIEQSGATEIELGIASDDVEAQSLGWPCVGAQAAAFGLVIARTRAKILIVPRGTTVASAAAADAHDARR